MNQQKEIPTTSDAEKWLTPLTFVWQGKVWEVDVNGKVTLKE